MNTIHKHSCDTLRYCGWSRRSRHWQPSLLPRVPGPWQSGSLPGDNNALAILAMLRSVSGACTGPGASNLSWAASLTGSELAIVLSTVRPGIRGHGSGNLPRAARRPGGPVAADTAGPGRPGNDSTQSLTVVLSEPRSRSARLGPGPGARRELKRRREPAGAGAVPGQCPLRCAPAQAVTT